MFHIIDDEPVLREFSESILTDYGCDVLCFGSGDQYLEYLKSPKFIKPVAVLSDVTMPGINGYDLTLKIRKIHPFQKIMLITGNANPSSHKKAARQTCYTLGKPYNPEFFLSVIGSIADCHQVHVSGKKSDYPQQCHIDPTLSCQFAQ